MLLAAAALVVALARPQRTVAAPQRAATVVLVNDVSGSMRAEDVDPDRLTAAQRSAKLFAESTPDNFRIGLVTFSDFAEQRVAPTTDRGAITTALEAMTADGGTAMGDGLARGLAAAQTPVPDRGRAGTRKLPAILVLLSDGENTVGVQDPVEVAREAAPAKVPVYTIALGTEEGEVVQRDPFGFETAHPGAARQGDAAADRPAHRRALLRGGHDRRRRVDLRADRDAAHVQAGEARGHRRVRRRRVRAAARRRRARPGWFGRPI